MSGPFTIGRLCLEAAGRRRSGSGRLKGKDFVTTLGPVRTGRIYVAPPGRHLLVMDGAVELSAGPRLNGYRPCVDTMFTAAADWADGRTIAVVLSGALDDAAVGAAVVSRAGRLRRRRTLTGTA